MTIDLDSTICETYGLDKEGARHLVTPASGAITHCWPLLMALTPPAALRETVGRVRYAGARGTHGAGRQRLLRS